MIMNVKPSLLFKYLFLFWFGGSTYVTMEVLWRGYSHWTMLLLAGTLFVIIGLLNEIWQWSTSVICQAIIGAGIATVLEFITGCVVNIWLAWDVWDYSNMWGNILGQICPLFTLLWVFVALLAIVVDDIVRWRFFGEDKPHYTLV